MTDVDPLIINLTIFILAIFVGYFVVWAVTPALHTPLMSVTNAISGIIIIGALLALSINITEDLIVDENKPYLDFPQILGFIATTIAAINIFGGFIVTQRMLSMFKKKKK